MCRVQLVAPDNGLGLTRDTSILKTSLEDLGCSVVASSAKTPPPTSNKHTLNIFLEVVNGRYFGTAHRNILIPNQEWFFDRWKNSRARFYSIWCKSNLAVEIFSKKGFNRVHYLGFTAEDRHLPHVDKIPEFVHLPGGSMFKNTHRVIEVWNKWGKSLPTLHIYSRHNWAERVVSPNIKLHTAYLSDESFRIIQNSYLYHLCPSMAEGFGHYIYEALSTGAVVITTDAPPMNENLGKTAILTKATIAGQHHWGTLWDVSAEQLYFQISRLLATPESVVEKLSKYARLSYIHTNTTFKVRLKEALADATK